LEAAAAGGVAVACFALLGYGLAGLHQVHVARSPLGRLAGHLVVVEGTLATDPEQGSTGWTASLRVDVVRPVVLLSAGAYRTHDAVWVEGDGEAPGFEAGDRLRIEGTLEHPSGDFGQYLVHRGYPASLAADEVHRMGPPTSTVLRVAGALRATLRSSLERVFGPKEAGLVMGLVLGDTSRLDPRIEETFRATGLSHLTAVSGENVAMFLAPILGLATMLGLGRWSRFLVGLAALVFFVLLTRAEPSVLRAAVMAGLVLIGVFLGRPRSPPAILGGAVLLLLATNPTLVYSIGFQLSVCATTGMALLAGPVAERLRLLPSGLALAAGATLGAQAGVTPLLLYHFGAVPTVSIPANLLAFPAVSPGMLVGLVAAAVGLASAPMGRLLALVATAPLRYLQVLAQRLGTSPLPSITSSGGGLLGLAVGFALVAGLGWWLRARRRLPRTALVVLALLVPAFVWTGAARAGPPSALTVTFFDVGQGDSALVRSPGGATILIDGGPDPEAVATKLAALGIRRIDVLVATHQHADHVAGLPAVLARFAVGVVVDPGCRALSPYYTEFLQAVRASGLPFQHPRPGAVLAAADVRMAVLGPEHCANGTESDPNNDSVIIRLTAGSASVLFTGDAQQTEQQAVLRDEGHLLSAVVLKVPHHGGATSVAAFLDAVHARVAVVSVGQPNRYGHPKPELLAELRRDGMRVFRTDQLGDITVVFREGGVLIESSRG
jgi:competence protein ComEC